MNEKTVSLVIVFILAISSSGHAARLADRKFETSDRIHLHYLEGGRDSTTIVLFQAG